ncbi:MAG: GNAT family protein [Clostridiales bacterium]
MEDLLIREAIPEDAENILAYLNKIGGESNNLLFGKNEFKISIDEEKEIIESKHNSKTNLMLIAILDKKIVSTSTLMGFNKKRIAHRGRIAISVQKEYWNKGIGTKMMTRIIEYAKKVGIIVIELEVKTDNINVITLYEKLGFVKIGIYKKYFKINNKYFDSYLMNLYL